MTTKAEILLIAPELSGLTDDQFNLAIANVENLVSLADTSRNAMAKTYLAAHLLTMARNPSAGGTSPSGGVITGQRAGRMSVTYANAMANIAGSNRYDTTKYGQMFNQIVRGDINTLTFMVV